MFSFCIVLLFFAFLLLVGCWTNSGDNMISRISVDPKTGHFIDALNRVRIYHGVNCVYKQAPWVPDSSHFDTLYSLSAVDAKNLSDWGFNFVRLGVMWPGVQPTKENLHNATYLNEVLTIVRLLAEQGIVTLADMHQDLFSRKFCGEGAPDWAVDYPSPGKLAFPEPLFHRRDFPPSSENPAWPNITACLKHGFADYYLTEAVESAFQDLYDNENGLTELLVKFWSSVASTLGASAGPSLIGYELINEPFPGNLYKAPDLALPGVADKQNLAPLYSALVSEGIRPHDQQSLVFFEKALFPGQLAPTGFEVVPGGDVYRNRSVFSYHVYCGNPKSRPAICDAENIGEYYFDQKDWRKLGAGRMMTEFGAVGQTGPELASLQFLLQLADSDLQSWSYWQYKNYHDITTQDPSSETFFNEDGSLMMDKLSALSRTYAQAIAGVPISMHYDPDTFQFSLVYTAGGSVVPGVTATGPTVIYLNEQLHYPTGYSVTTSGPVSWSSPRENIVLVVAAPMVSSPQKVTVVIKRK